MRVIVFILLLTQLLLSDILKENYITIDFQASHPKMILDFESDNLDQFIILDTNENGLISWKEIKAKKDEIANFVLPHLKISTDGELCQNSLTNFEVYRRAHQSYIKLHIDLLCSSPKTETKLFYDLFFDVDKGQKVFLTLKDQNSSQPMILSSRTREITIKTKHASAFQSFINFLTEGIWHIWTGFDHILFLLMLLIPSVIYYHQKKIKPQNSLKKILIAVLKIVTAFTIAHSITLALSILDIVNINMKFIEISIALSVLFTALNNIFVFMKTKIWILAFGFGLIHGFGFANALKEMTLKSSELIYSLVGFNLGVEVGQLAIVIVVVPLIFLTRHSKFYRYMILYGLATFTAIISLLWSYERYFDISI